MVNDVCGTERTVGIEYFQQDAILFPLRRTGRRRLYGLCWHKLLCLCVCSGGLEAVERE